MLHCLGFLGCAAIFFSHCNRCFGNPWDISKNILGMCGETGVTEMSGEMEKKHSGNAEPVEET